jgi:hypothetical protein
MFIIDFQQSLFHVLPKSLISAHEIFSLGGDPGPSSGWAADLPLQKSKAKPFFQGLD